MVPNRQAWDGWQETSIDVLNDFKSAYPGIMSDGDRMQRGGRRARALVLGEPYAPSGQAADSSSSVDVVRKLLRLERENPVAWDFGETLARMALDGRSSYLVKRIHENGEEGARFYAEEISSAIPEALREAVVAGDIDVPTPISADAEEAARLAAYTSLMDWLTSEPRSA